MKPVLKIVLCVGLFAKPALAQGPAIAAKGPTVDTAAGYSYVSMSIPTVSRVSLNGVDANLGVNFSQYFGVRLDVGYDRANNVLGTGRHADILSYMGGPVFYPFRVKKWSTYAQGLFGAARVTGPVPTGTAILIGGYANKFAYAVGGGVQYNFKTSFAIRAGADYLHTAYFTPQKAITGQNNVRIVAELVYSFRTRRQ